MTASDDDNPHVIAFPPLLYGASFAVALLLQALQPMTIMPLAIGFWLGIAFLVCGGAVALWGQRTMRRAGTNVNPSLPATALVTTGPFRYSRNPLYVALTLLYVGLALAVNTLWALLVLAPLLVTMRRGVIAREERYLEAKFGEAYRRYRSDVRRWL
ncbi:MAG: methyltransferase family protein [Candidatus Binatia bacterium]